MRGLMISRNCRLDEVSGVTGVSFGEEKREEKKIDK